MSRALRIAVADDEPDMRQWYAQMLPRLGHTVVSAATTGSEFVRQCVALRPDLAITDIRMPDLDGIEAARQIFECEPLPIVLVSAYHDETLIERAVADHVQAYLVKPIELSDLEPALALARRRFEQFMELQREASDLRQALQDRKIIERAKGVLMKRKQIDEAAAFRLLQQLASDQNLKLVAISQQLVVADSVFQSESM